MVRKRLLLVALLTVAVPTHVVVLGATELCMIFVADADGSAAVAHDHAAHDHADDDASDAVHCGPCSTASIAPSPKFSIPALPQGGIVSPLLASPSNGLPHELDRPPLAL